MDLVWSNLANEYEILDHIGAGTYGQVKKARHMKTSTDVAIKLIKDAFGDGYQAKKIISEIQIMRKLSLVKGNCFTTKIFDVVTPKFDPKSSEPLEYLFIVMDYDETDLKQVIKE